MRTKEEKKRTIRFKRKMRIRKKLRGCADRPRLTVFRSDAHIYAQLIDDEAGKTLASCSSIDNELKPQVSGKGNKEVARLVGETLAKRAVKINIGQVAFDRGPYKFHGRVEELANGARESGLKF